jgi:hypothetical protein
MRASRVETNFFSTCFKSCSRREPERPLTPHVHVGSHDGFDGKFLMLMGEHAPDGRGRTTACVKFCSRVRPIRQAINAWRLRRGRIGSPGPETTRKRCDY